MKKNSYTPAEYADAAVIAREAGKTMLERLEWVALKPQRILAMGCGAVFCTGGLRERYPEATITTVDTSLPVPQQQFDLIVANLFIPWCADIKMLLREWRQALRPEGLLMFTSLGPDTLQELSHQEQFLPHFMDMHDLGDELVHAGFADPVMDAEHITLQYRKWEQLSHELCVTEMISHPLLPRDNPPLSLTYEVIYGHAWGTEISAEYSPDNEGIIKIPLSHLRRR